VSYWKCLSNRNSMNSSLRHLTRKIFDFGSGELLSRLFSVATVLFLAHAYGAVVVGVFALAQGMFYYAYPIIDFGLRHIGARLIASTPSGVQEIVRRVQRRRLIMAGLLLPCLLLYAKFAKVPPESRMFLFAFSATGCLYALSPDWIAWGKERLRLVSFGRAVVPIAIFASLLLARKSSGVLWWLLLGNIVGNVLQGAIFWFWWTRQHKPAKPDEASLARIRQSLAWRRTSIMGLAWLCNLAFGTIDMLMLGVMSNAREVGFYSAAYRVLNQVLAAYYFMTIALYPHLARQDVRQRAGMLTPRILLALFGGGLVIAVLLALSRRFVVTLLFGHQFLPATGLLLLLAFAVPLDFLTSYLSNAYIAWGMDKKVLACTAVAASTNIVLNLIWIPVYGATAAAVNTLISYVIFLASLAMTGYSAKELRSRSEAVPEPIIYAPDAS
jgi:O-antigen/teichoic acid export membrane protein